MKWIKLLLVSNGRLLKGMYNYFGCWIDMDEQKIEVANITKRIANYWPRIQTRDFWARKPLLQKNIELANCRGFEGVKWCLEFY